MKGNIEGDKYLLQQYKSDIQKENQVLVANKKEEQKYQKQIKIASWVQGLSIGGVFVSLIILASIISFFPIIIPILVAIGCAMGAVVSGIIRYNNKELLSLIDLHTKATEARVEYLNREVEKLEKRIKEQENTIEKEKKSEKVQAFLLYTPKEKKIASQDCPEENLKEKEETYVS